MVVMSLLLLRGSPPHTWRILAERCFKSKWVGITSTYVENTLVIVPVNLGGKDHLHIRGEYFMLFKLDKPNSGSPPHTWRIQ